MLDGAPGAAAHWDEVYARSAEAQLSWFEPDSTCSLDLLDRVGARPGMSVIDVGAGASRLVDHLVARGFTDISALDVSSDGLSIARERLGASAGRVQWIVADLLTWNPKRRFGVWHDRAVFHSLSS